MFDLLSFWASRLFFHLIKTVSDSVNWLRSFFLRVTTIVKSTIKINNSNKKRYSKEPKAMMFSKNINELAYRVFWKQLVAVRSSIRMNSSV